MRTTGTGIGLALAGLLAMAGTVQSGEVASRFEPLQAFARYVGTQPADRQRGANGLPGPDYWQNRADYRIEATLDAAGHALDGEVRIDYRNNSPDALAALWLQLDQNHYRVDARANFAGDAMPAVGQHTAGMHIARVEGNRGDGWHSLHWEVFDTRLRVSLSRPLPADGGQLALRIAYRYRLPGRFGGRTQWFESRHGPVFEVAQWYPRMAVYDDLRGWNTLPYLNNEFYLEYGTIDYRITVPGNMIVAGSGELVNAAEVLDAQQLQRLARARTSDATVMIRSPDEVAQAAAKVAHGQRTWHFHMANTRDVAFVASAALVWDAARINLPDGRQALAMSVYPVESLEGDSAWAKSTQFVKYTVEYYSKHWYVYPWPVALAVGGKVGGMEYPGVAFDWWKLAEQDLFGLTVHEIGHSWFPMIVGFNERRHAWMDEGFNTFANIPATEAFADGRYAPKRDGEYAPGGGNPADEIVPVLTDPAAPPILTRPDAIAERWRHPVTYFKTAFGLVLLREQILGPQRFDAAFRRFVQAWAFKHPAPDDFFRAMTSAGGEDLDWFWRGWFAHNWAFDMALQDARMVDEKGDESLAVTVANLGRLALPATLEVRWSGGDSTRVRIPVETWLQHRQFEMRLPGRGRALELRLDPDHALPDANRANNQLTLP